MLTAVRKATEDRAEVSVPKFRTAAADKGKAMVQARKEDAEKRRRLRIAQEDEANMGSCVVMVEQIFQSQLVELVLAAAAVFQRRLQPLSPTEPAKKLFTVSVDLKAAGVVLTPSSGEFQAALSSVWQDIVGAVDALPQLTSMKAVRRHGLEQGLRRRVGDILAQSRDWSGSTSAVSAAIGASLEELLASARSDLLAPCGQVQAFGEAWSESKYMARAHTFRQVAEDMEHVTKLRDDLSRCRFQRIAGTIFMDGRKLRERLSAIPENVLNVMKQVLASLAHDRSIATYRRFDAVIKAVDEKPKDGGSSSNAVYSGTYQWAVEEQAALEETCEELRSMYDLLALYNYRVSLDDKVHLDAVAAQEHDLTHRAMLEARLFLDRLQLEEEDRSTLEASEAGEARHAGNLTITVQIDEGVGSMMMSTPLLDED